LGIADDQPLCGVEYAHPLRHTVNGGSQVSVSPAQMPNMRDAGQAHCKVGNDHRDDETKNGFRSGRDDNGRPADCEDAQQAETRGKTRQSNKSDQPAASPVRTWEKISKHDLRPVDQ
jgi:hypothetical protein